MSISPENHPIKKQKLRLIPIIIILAIAIYSGQAQELKLPPRADNHVGLVTAMSQRMSVRAFKNEEVMLDHLSWLMWSVGQCRVKGEVPGRVAVIVDSVEYLLDPDSHVLIRSDIQLPDLRMYEAPVHIYLLASVSSDTVINDDLWIWRGMAGQAIYLGAPTLGLGTVTVRGIGFPVGYSVKRIDFQPVSVQKEGSLPGFTGIQYPTLDKAIAEKQTKFNGAESVSQEAVSALLWSSYGYALLQETGGRIHRTVPSARGRYPMEVFAVLKDSIFQYIPEEHRLNKIGAEEVTEELADVCHASWIVKSPCTLILVWDSEKMDSRESALYEAGAMVYNVQLMGKALELSTQWTAIDDSSAVQRLLGLDPGRTVVPLVAICLKGVSSESSKAVILKDGSYIGESTEWPEMKVEVVIEGGEIKEVKVLEDLGTPEFSQQVVELLPKQIILRGNTEVDAISGATLSSNSLKKAVSVALEKAK